VFMSVEIVVSVNTEVFDYFTVIVSYYGLVLKNLITTSLKR